MGKWVRDFISLTLTGELREQPRRTRVQYAAPYAPDPRPMNRLLPLLQVRLDRSGVL